MSEVGDKNFNIKSGNSSFNEVIFSSFTISKQMFAKPNISAGKL